MGYIRLTRGCMQHGMGQLGQPTFPDLVDSLPGISYDWFRYTVHRQPGNPRCCPGTGQYTHTPMSARGREYAWNPPRPIFPPTVLVS